MGNRRQKGTNRFNIPKGIWLAILGSVFHKNANIKAAFRKAMELQLVSVESVAKTGRKNEKNWKKACWRSTYSECFFCWYFQCIGRPLSKREKGQCMFFLPTFGSGVGGVINHKKAAPQTVRMTKKQEKCYMFFFQRCSVLKKPSLGCQMHRKCMEIKSFFCLKTGQTRRFNLWKFAVVVCLEKSSSEDWSVLPTFIKLQMALTGFFHYHFQHFWPFWAILSIRKSHFRRCGSKTSQGFGVGSKRRGGWKLYWPLTAAATHTAAAGRLAGWATGNFISPRETIRAAVCVWGGGLGYRGSWWWWW